ncbi:GNAT family N-acetyltransferase [Bacillus sp. RAR_GA_16]|uniref:GNAT family N-acetyltransferase n=1 Tax=Bacillus sp. RAR_GA_16 TaxID=2876774 RepID=UPI001CCDACC0|nr:GNAT family N-acetyltransferase [Bacillus sp. RAR_GA_16]MCA0171873.1 GNAT family N-acetyltransferase [Bacillus sp. RAR_GA_16]
MKIRNYHHNDLNQIIELFLQTIQYVNRKDYSSIQITAWTNSKSTLTRTSIWKEEFKRNFTYVAEREGDIVGFIDLTATGHLERLYIHYKFQRQGIATELFSKVEKTAKEHNLMKLTTEASITARPFFERHQFNVIKDQTKVIDGVSMINFLMSKTLN